MKVFKSSRHSKITGDFAESLVLYWLSKYGFECAKVDHTGIDLIARNPHTDEVMGISVKSRCRTAGKEGHYVRIGLDDLPKVDAACLAFGCVPYFAIVVDAASAITAFVLSRKRLLELFPPAQTQVGWKMSPGWLARYKSDPDIKSFRFEHATTSWWPEHGTERGPAERTDGDD